MLECRHTDKKEVAENWFSKLSVGKPFPGLIFDKKHGNIVFSFWADGTMAGVAYGHKEEKNSFLLVEIKLKENYVSARMLAAVLTACLEKMKKNYAVESMRLVLVQEYQEEKPYIYRLMSKIPGYRVSCDGLQSLGIQTKNFFHFRKYNWYHPELLNKKGINMTLWGDYPQELKENIEKGNENTESDYLSPGIEEAWECDPCTSFVMTDKNTGALLGWFITERIDKEIVKVRRLYIYREARKRYFGAAAIAEGLDRIVDTAEMLLFDVKCGNRQMERVVNKYCTPILAFRSMKYSVKIKSL